MSLTDSVRSAVAWRSGSQIVAQIITWSVTLAVVRILDPGDYGLFAMGQVIITFLSFLNGYGFASALIQRETIDRQMVRQTFGMLILVNFALAAIQFALAPVVADYYGQPLVEKLLHVQVLLFLSVPFVAIPEVLLVRELDFKRPAVVPVPINSCWLSRPCQRVAHSSISLFLPSWAISAMRLRACRVRMAWRGGCASVMALLSLRAL